MSTEAAKLKNKISKLSTDKLDEKINAGQFTPEELQIAKELIHARTGRPIEEIGVEKEETPKKKGAAKKGAADKPAKEKKEKAPKEEKPKKEKKVKEPKPRKEGHGFVRGAIKVLLEKFTPTNEVRTLVAAELKEKFGKERSIHYSEVKSVLDKLKEDKDFAAKWDETFTKVKEEKPAKEPKAKKAKEEEVATEQVPVKKKKGKKDAAVEEEAPTEEVNEQEEAA